MELETKLGESPGRTTKCKIATAGSLFRRPDSPFLWMCWSRNGRKYRQSSGTTSVKDARAMLAKLVADSINKPFDPATITKVTVEDLVKAFLDNCEAQELKSIDDAKCRWRLHLKPEFDNWRAAQVTTEKINGYRKKRKLEGAAKATINRELALLKAAYKFGMESEPPLCLRVPKVKLPSEKGNERKGFFEDGAQHKLYEYCGELWFRGAVEIGRVFGWRISEVKGLRVRHANFTDRTLSLDPGSTKNDEGRVVSMPNDLFLLLQLCAREKGPEDFLLTRANGKPIKDFRTTWKKACEYAGCPGRLFHDLRRTMAKDLIAAGVSEGVIMEIGGWKTRSVFERYNIKSQDAKAKAVQNREDREKEQAAQKLANVTSSSHVLDTLAPVSTTPSVN